MSRTKKQKRTLKRTEAPAPDKRAKADGSAKPKHGGQATRETIESLVIAFVLAFLFRTFQAEAFVIPTGSMAPTLMGRHKDVDCAACGLRYRVNDSEMKPEDARRLAEEGHSSPAEMYRRSQTLAGECPNCRLVMPYQPIPGAPGTASIDPLPSYSGDRLLVNKYIYSFTDPERWDVVVFKYPGNAHDNYIKRLVGLPNEKLQIMHGDLFVGPLDSDGDAPYEITRKPPDKIMAMRQLVHDTDHDPAALWQSGYPLRWASDDDGAAAWETTAEADGAVVDQRYRVEAGQSPSWLRYRHIPPEHSDWARVQRRDPSGPIEPTPQLVTDFNAYNTQVNGFSPAGMDPQSREIVAPYVRPEDEGLHWTGDLLLEAELDVASDEGTLLLELVEAGRRFRCAIDVSTGEAQLTTAAFGDEAEFTPLGGAVETDIIGPGDYRVRFANVDDQLLLWVDDELVDLAPEARYDADELFGGRATMRPRTSADQPGDLSPAAVGAEGLELEVSRLAVWRDIYYIADKRLKPTDNHGVVSDFPATLREQAGGARVAVMDTDRGLVRLSDLRSQPELWDLFTARRTQEFELTDDQFFVLGDNSAESADCRLWTAGNGASDGKPGGPYLERSLLIGKAAFVYWPHALRRVPGTGIPIRFFPNFWDMRIVR